MNGGRCVNPRMFFCGSLLRDWYVGGNAVCRHSLGSLLRLAGRSGPLFVRVSSLLALVLVGFFVEDGLVGRYTLEALQFMRSRDRAFLRIERV